MSIDQPLTAPVAIPRSPDADEGKAAEVVKTPSDKKRPQEIGGPPGPEPTRYGDWQFNGRVTDF